MSWRGIIIMKLGNATVGSNTCVGLFNLIINK